MEEANEEMEPAVDSNLPLHALHPLHVLDQYLASIESRERKRDDIVNENDLATEQRPCCPTVITDKEEAKRREEVIRVADFLYGGSSLESALGVLDTDGAIRKICSYPSNRQAYLVQGTTTTTRSGRNNGGATDVYFCLFDPSSPFDDKGGFYYCSCRSFFEKAKSDPLVLCKHLLALKLMPHLNCFCQVEEVSDSAFASLLMRQVFDKASSTNMYY
jgi:hypothetical protein